MNIRRPFNHDGFKSWLKAMIAEKAVISIAINFPGKHCSHIGDPNVGLKILESLVRKEKRKSMEWVKPAQDLKKLSKPLNEMIQRDLTLEVPHVIKHFMGEKGRYGCGESYFWDHKVSLGSLSISKENKKLKNMDNICLSKPWFSCNFKRK